MPTLEISPLRKAFSKEKKNTKKTKKQNKNKTKQALNK